MVPPFLHHSHLPHFQDITESSQMMMKPIPPTFHHFSIMVAPRFHHSTTKWCDLSTNIQNL